MSEQKTYKTYLPISQYDGTIATGVGILDETKSLVVVSIARPGSTAYTQSQGSSNLKRYPVRGDIAIFAYKHTGEREEGGEVIQEGQVEATIMASTPWNAIQIKNAQGEEQEPFFKTPFDVQQRVDDTYGGRPVRLESSIRVLANKAVIESVKFTNKQVKEGKIIRRQQEFAEAAAAATELAAILQSRRPSQNVASYQQENVSEGATTAEDLGI